MLPHRPAKAFGITVPYDAPIEDLRAFLEIAGPSAWAACLALGAKPEREAFDLLVELTRREDLRYRNLAIQALGAHPLGAQAADRIVEGLSDPVAQVVRTSCEAAGRLRLVAARDKLVGLLASSDAQIRFHAVRALGEIAAADGFGLLWNVSKKDKAEFVRKEAAETLRRTASPKTWRYLFDRWKLDPLPRHRLWACELLSAFGKDSDMPELRRLVRDRNAHVRKAAEITAAERGVS